MFGFKQEASMITANAHPKRHVSSLYYIQIMYHENPGDEVGYPIICMWALFSMKFRDNLPHAEISHIFPSLLSSYVYIPVC
jgi:hypothetical protein